MKINSGQFVKWSAIVLCLVINAKAFSQALLPSELFSQLPQYSKMKLSPDGNKLAFFQNQQNFTHLIVLDLQSKSRQSLVNTDNTKFRLDDLQWVNNKRLVFSTKFGSNNRGIGSQRSNRRSASNSSSSEEASFLFLETRLLSVDADGSGEPKAIDLAQTQMDRKRNHIAQIQDNILDILPNEPNYFILGIDIDEEDFQSVYKVNVKNHSKSRIKLADPPIRRWIVDRQGRERVGIAYDDRKASTYSTIYDIEKEVWTETWEHDAALDSQVMPLGFGLEPHTLYVRAKHDGKYAVFTTDTRDPTFPLTLKISDPNRDILGDLIHSSSDGDVVGVHYKHDGFTAIYWDDFYQPFQQSIDKALPNTSNHLISFSADQNRYLVYSTGDKVPGVFLLGDRKAKQLSQIAENYSGLNQDNLSGTEKINFALTDGTNISAFLTRPASKTSQSSPTPAIVLAKDRDANRFDYLAEYFASRGIAVLQLDSESLPTYSEAFREEGLLSWGVYTSNQLQNAAEWLIDQGIADKSKLCIAGSGYSSQAALSSAINTPKLWRCAISIAGISDLVAFREGYRDELNYKSIRRQIGDDNNTLNKLSASGHADKIAAAIFLAHGENDLTVPVTQSQKLAKALDSESKTFEYIELSNGTHDLDLQENRTRLFQALDTFIANHLL